MGDGLFNYIKIYVVRGHSKDLNPHRSKHSTVWGGLADDHHRTVRMLDDAVADAADQHFRHKAHAPAAHHDQVGRLFLCRLADDLGRIAGFADRAEGDSRAARFFGGRGEDFSPSWRMCSSRSTPTGGSLIETVGLTCRTTSSGAVFRLCTSDTAESSACRACLDPSTGTRIREYI